MIVADTNLVAYLLIEGEQAAHARAVWREDPAWKLPSLWRSELLDVLATSHGAGALTADEARLAWQRAEWLLGAAEQNPTATRVLDVAMDRGISAYDAHFVALAEDLGARLATADRRLAASCPDVAILLRELCGRG